jgi:hypothetical protein
MRVEIAVRALADTPRKVDVEAQELIAIHGWAGLEIDFDALRAFRLVSFGGGPILSIQ